MALPRKNSSGIRENKSLNESFDSPENALPDVTDSLPADDDPNCIPSSFHIRDKQSEFMLLHTKVDSIVSLLEIGEIPDDAVKRLIHALSPYQETSFDEDFSVRDELIVQMRLVKSVRMSILDSSGKMKKDTTIAEVKSVLDSSMKLADMLNKVNKELINQERLQAVEAAFMDVVGDFGKDEQVEFIKNLERRMKAQKALRK